MRISSYRNDELVEALIREAAKVGTARSGLVIDPIGSDNTYLLELKAEVLARLKRLEQLSQEKPADR